MYGGMVLQYAFVQQLAVAQHFQFFIFKVVHPLSERVQLFIGLGLRHFKLVNAVAVFANEQSFLQDAALGSGHLILMVQHQGDDRQYQHQGQASDVNAIRAYFALAGLNVESVLYFVDVVGLPFLLLFFFENEQ